MRLPSLLSFVLLLSACGQAGDLYLPSKQPAPQESAKPAAPPAPAPAPDEEKKKESQ